jgi:GGDEF domain-containing protein
VADTPVEALLARADELARRWAIALILARPLDCIGEIPLEDLAGEAPELFTQVVRALASEAALERLLGRGEAGSLGLGVSQRLGVLAGARDAVAMVGACEALRGVVWDALLDELRDPQPRQVAELSDRLAAVCSAMTAALLASEGNTGSGPATPDAGVLSDFAQAEPMQGAPPQPHEREQPTPEQREQTDVAPGQPGFTAGHPGERDFPASPWEGKPRIEIRDVRGEGPSAWIGSIGRRLERYEEDGLPFAVLLVEVVDMDRLAQAGSASGVSQLIGRVEAALSEELRPADLLTRESQGRYWLVTPETDGVGVRMLAERLARSVRSSASDHGAPLEVAIGIAACPDDGRDAATLAAHADAGVYAARASGRSIAPADGPQ